jgi:riboflavin synthase
VNLERCLRIGDRLDGHMVQGHVDTVVRCQRVEDLNGSWSFNFELPEQAHLLVEKGSVCINGVSLTIAQLNDRSFGVAIIPYTYAHTTFNRLRAGMLVNIEFDVLGKYVQRMLAR